MKIRSLAMLAVAALAVACAASAPMPRDLGTARMCTPSGSTQTCNYNAECCSGVCLYEGGVCK